MSSFFGMLLALDNLIYDKFVGIKRFRRVRNFAGRITGKKEQPQQQNNKAVQGKKPINSQRGHKQS